MLRVLLRRKLERDPGFAVKFYSLHAGRARKYGPDAAPSLRARRNLAVALYRNGEYGKSEAEFSALLACVGPATSVGDGSLWDVRGWHARALIDLERFEEAEREWRELADERDRELGSDHPDAVGAHEDHAGTLARLGRFAEAEAELSDVIARRAAAEGAGSEATLRARGSRAVALDTLGRHEESEAEWRALAEEKGRLLGDSDSETLLVREKHAESLYALGRRQEAAAEYGAVSALRAASLGADDPDTRRARNWQASIQREMGISGSIAPG